jgi:hypothetical protein
MFHQLHVELWASNMIGLSVQEVRKFLRNSSNYSGTVLCDTHGNELIKIVRNASIGTTVICTGILYCNISWKVWVVKRRIYLVLNVLSRCSNVWARFVKRHYYAVQTNWLLRVNMHVWSDHRVRLKRKQTWKKVWILRLLANGSRFNSANICDLSRLLVKIAIVIAAKPNDAFRNLRRNIVCWTNFNQ